MRRSVTRTNEKAQARVIPAMVILLLFTASVLALSDSLGTQKVSTSKKVNIFANTQVQINQLENGSLLIQLLLDNGTILSNKKIDLTLNGSQISSNQTKKGMVATPLLKQGLNLIEAVFSGESSAYLNPSKATLNISSTKKNETNNQTQPENHTQVIPPGNLHAFYLTTNKNSFYTNETILVTGRTPLKNKTIFLSVYLNNLLIKTENITTQNNSFSYEIKPPIRIGNWSLKAQYQNLSEIIGFQVTSLQENPSCQPKIHYGKKEHEKIVFNQPIQWKQKINITNPCQNKSKTLTIQLPEDAFNVSTNENSSIQTHPIQTTIAPNSTKKLQINFLTTPITFSQQKIQTNVSKLIPDEAFNVVFPKNKTKRLTSVNATKIFLNTTRTIPYENISIDIPVQAKNFSFFKIINKQKINAKEETRSYDDYFVWKISKMNNITAVIQENIIIEQGKVVFGKPVNWTLSAGTFEVKYQTPAPTKEESFVEGYKRIQVNPNSNITYKDVVVPTKLPGLNYVPRVYELKNEQRTKNNYLITASDKNNDSSYDELTWEMPSLTKKTFDVDIDLIRVENSLIENKTWEINFSTQGTANLTIEELNQTLNGLSFLSLECGNKTFDSQNPLFVKDYQCNSPSTLRLLLDDSLSAKLRFGQDYDIISVDVNNTVKILDKKEEKIEVLPGQVFCVERTINGPTGETANFAPMYSHGLDLVSSKVLTKEQKPLTEEKQKPFSLKQKFSEIKKRVFDADQPKFKKEFEIHSIREKLPKKLKELRKIAYPEEIKFNSNVTVQYCFKAPTWKEMKTGEKPSSGRISYLTYKGEAYDYETTTWWNSSWSHRKQLNITVGPNTPYKGYAGYTVQLEINTANLVSNGNLLENGSDLRVAYYNGSSMIELDRLNATNFNTSNTKIRFQLQANITANSTDSNYYLYYGNPSAGTPPENASNVYIWYDDASTNRLNQYQEGRIDSTCLGGLWGDSFSNGSGNYSFNTGDNNCDSIKPSNITERDIYFEFEEYQTGAHPNNMDSGVVVRWINSGAGAGLSEDSNHFYYYGLADSTFRGGAYGEHDDVRAAQRSNVIITQGALGQFPATTWTRMGIAVWDVNPTNIKTYFDNESGGWGGYYFNGTHAAGSDHESAGLFGPWLQQDIGSVRNLLARRYTEPEPNVTVVSTEVITKLKPTIDEPAQNAIKTRNNPFTMNGTLNCTGNSTAQGCPETKGWAQYYSVFSPVVSWTETTESDFNSSTESTNISISESLNLESNNTPSWWDENWGYRKRVNVTNENYSRTLDEGRAVVYTLNHSDLVSSGKSLANGNDLRLLYWNSTGSRWTELDRDVSLLNSSSTQLWFSVQVNISANSSDSDYFLYYGNPDASSPPTNSTEIYGSGAVFVAHYDNSSTGVDGETPSTESGTTYNTGQFGTGINVSNGDDLRYSRSEVVYVPEGTMEFWFKPDWNASDNAGHEFFHMHESGGQPKYFILNKDDNSPSWGSSNYLKFMAEDSSDADIRCEDNYNFVEGTWYHIAASWEFPGTNDGDIFIYVNGQQVATASGLDNPISPDDSVAIGDYLNSYGTAQGEADGIIDEFRIWNSMKSTNDFNYFLPKPNITGLSEEALTVKPDGYYISSVFDPGSSDVQYENISWLAETNANATVSVYSRTSTGALANWWDQDWQYKKEINISNTAGELTNYQVKVTLNTTELNSTGKMRSDCGDIRFVKYSGSYTELDYWIETECNVSGGNTSFWVEVPTISNNTNTTIYLYYGNSGASSESNGTSTFEFFDDFPGSGLDSRWTATGSASVSGGYARVNSGAVYTSSTQGSSPQNRVFEAKVFYHTQADTYSGLEISNDTSTDGGNNPGADALAYIMTDGGSDMDIWGADGTVATYNIVNNDHVYQNVQNDEDYIIGFEFRGSSQVSYFMENYSDGSELGRGTYSGTWDDDYYIWLGYYQGAGSGSADIDDISVDWIRVRKYASTTPVVYKGNEINYTTASQDSDNLQWSNWFLENNNSAPQSPDRRYFQYKVFLNTSNPKQLPLFKEIELDYKIASVGWKYMKASGTTFTTTNPYEAGDLNQSSPTDSPSWSVVPKSEGNYSVRFCSNSSETDVDFNCTDTRNISVYVQPSLTSFSSSLDPVGKNQTALLTVRMLDETSSAMQGYNISFVDETGNGTPHSIGYAITDSQGYARINYTIPSDASLSLHTLNATYNGSSPNFILSDSLTEQITVSSLPQINNVSVDPQTAGFGYFPFIQANVTDEKGLDKVVINITDSEGTSQYEMTPQGGSNYTYNFTDTWEIEDYSFIVIANNTDGVESQSDPQNFYVQVYSSVNFSTQEDEYKNYEKVYLSNSQPGWHYSGWSYKREVTVSGGSENLTDYQVEVNLGSDDLNFSNAESNGSDVRFSFYNTTSSSEENASHWIESWNATTEEATVWVKVPFIDSSEGATLYMYYGKPGASSGSNGTEVFEFFDEFSGAALDAKWTATGAASVGSGYMRVNTGCIYTGSSQGTTPQNRIFEAKVFYHNQGASYSGLEIANDTATDGSNNPGADALAYIMTDNANNMDIWGADGTQASYNIVNDGNVYGSTQNNEDYLIGFEFRSTSQISYYMENYSDGSELGRNTQSGTWDDDYYVWLGHFQGASSGVTDCDDMSVDWVRVRKYTSSEPTSSVGNVQLGDVGIQNNGISPFKGYLKLIVRNWDGDSWENINPPLLNPTLYSVPGSGVLNLTQIWSDEGGWNTTNNPPGWYQAYAVMFNSSSSPREILNDSNGNLIQGWYNFTIAEPGLQMTNLTHENEHDQGINEYETGDSIDWINVTVQAINNTALDANVTLSLLDKNQNPVAWGPTETKQCGEIAENDTCEKQWDNSSSGYTIPTTASSGRYTFYWNVTMNVSGGQTTTNKSTTFTINSLPSTFSKTTNGTTLYKPSWSYYNFTFNNTWTENLTNAVIKINCPAINGFSCKSIDSGSETYNIGTIANLTETTITFNVSANESAPSDDYDVNVTLNYTNPGNENRSWQEKQNQVFKARVLGHLEITAENYTVNVTREQAYDFKVYSNNTGDVNATNVWLNYSLPSGWTNTSGNLERYLASLENHTLMWNNVTLSIGSNAPLGQQQVQLSSASDEGQEDWLNLDTYVYSNTTVSEIDTNNSWVDKGDALKVWAKVIYTNGTAVQNQNVTFYCECTGSVLGSDITNSSGYAEIDVVIPSGASLGSRTWNATVRDNSSAFIYGDHNTTDVVIRRKPSIDEVNINPQNVGYGEIVTINATITDDGDLATKLVRITYPESGTQENITMSSAGLPDVYELEFNDTWEAGQYNFTIWVNDTYGSYNESTQYNFTVTVSALMSVKPVNDSYNANEYVNLTSPPSYWWNSSWNFRKQINLSNTAGNLTNHQVEVETNLSSEYSNDKIQQYCEDARFTYYNSTSGNEIACDYWIESCNLTDSGSVKFMVEVPFIQNNTNTTIYLYYGNSGASSESNGTSTFEFFDDFPGSSLDSKWTATGSASVSGGYMRVNTGCIYTSSSQGTTPQDRVFEAKVFYHNRGVDYSGLEISNDTATQGSNNGGDALAYIMTDDASNMDVWGADGTNTDYNIVNGGNVYGSVQNDEDYLIGFEFRGSSQVSYYMEDYSDGSELGRNTQSGTWDDDYYVWLGYFTGASAGTHDIDDMSVDWVRIRKYASTTPSVNIGVEEHTGSVISNEGSTNFTGYLIMKIQKNDSGSWQDVTTVVDDLGNSTLRTVNSTDLDLSAIWNPTSWYTGTEDAGTYRVFSEMVDQSGNVLSTGAGYLNDSYNFEIAQPPLNLNINNISIYDVTSSAPANRHFYTNDFLDSGLSKTFTLYKDKIYRIEVYVDNTGSSTWDFNATNVSYLNLSSSWIVDNENDTWYSNETNDGNARTDTSFTGGTWNGNVTWNTTQLNGTVAGSNDAKFFFIVNFSTEEDREVEFRIDHPDFVENVESTFHVVETDSVPPFLYNNIYNFTDDSINRGQSTTAYARWNETIGMANITYTTTSPVIEATDYNDSISNPQNWTNFTINSASNWFLGIHEVTLEAKDESNNWNSSLPALNLTVWGLARVTSSQLNDSTIDVGNKVKIECRVKDNTNSSAIPNYVVHFYNSTHELGTNTTLATGWASFVYADNTPGTETLKCNITDNGTTYHQIDSNNYQEKTLTTQETILPNYTTIQGPGRAYKGESVLLNVSWHDNYNLDYAVLSVNDSGVWVNYTQGVSGTQDWGNFSHQVNTSMTPGVLAWKQYANDSFGNTNGTMPLQTIDVWGWSKVVNGEVSPSSIQETNSTVMFCKVIDANSSTGISGYNISFWRGNNYIGSNTTNASGWAEYNFSVATAGVYTIKCNITDNSSASYNASNDNYETDGLTVTVGNDTQAPQAIAGTYQINGTSLYSGGCVKLSAQWDESVNTSWVEYNVSSVLIEQNLSGPFTGNWTNVTLCTNSSWSLGRHVAKLYARDNSSNLNDTLSYKEFNLWGQSRLAWINPTGNVDRENVNLYCNVTDNAGLGVEDYPIEFYDQEYGLINTATTNSSGIATVTFDFLSNEINVGPEEMTCVIDDNNTLYYNVTGSKTVDETINLYGNLSITASPSTILNRGKTQNLESTITDENGNAAKDQNGNPASLTVTWFNSTHQIATGEDTTWTIEPTTTLGPEELKVNVTATYYHAGEDNASVYIYGWSNVTWIQPNGGSYEDNELLDLTCRVLDKNNSQAINLYPVSFYDDMNLLGTESTNSSGYAVHQINTNTLSNGVHTLKCVITDNETHYYNDTSENEDNTSITVDSAAPVISITYPVNTTNYTSSTLDLNYTVTDDNTDSCWYNLDMTTNQSLPGCANDQLTGLSDAVHNITVYANDTAGNENSTWIWFRVDANPPVISVESPENTTYNTQQISFNTSLSEPGSWCGYSLDAQANTTMTMKNNTYYYNQTTITEGTHNVTFYCNDTYGNMDSSIQYFTIDTNEPNVTLNQPQDKTNSSNATITFNCSAEDETSIANVSLYGNWSGWSSKNTNSSGTNNTYYLFQENLPQGTFTWNCRACDNANCSFDANRTITIDTTNPVISVQYPENSSYNTTTLDLNYTVTDDNTDSCWYNLNNTSNETLVDCNNITLPELNEDVHNITLYANDTAGNEGKAYAVFTIDLTAPGISLSSPENKTYNTTNAVDLNYSVNDNFNTDICWYSLDGNAFTYKSSCQNTTLSGLSNDAHNVTVYVNDTAGNINSTTQYFTIDVAELVVTPEQPENISYNQNWVWGNITLNKIPDSCNYSLDNQANQTMSNDTSTHWYANITSISEANHNITFYCNDPGAGTVSQSTFVHFTIDLTNPSLNVINPENTTYNVSSVNINYTSSDNVLVDKCSYSLDGQNNQSLPSCQNDSINPSDGTHNITIYVNDTAGNYNQSTVYFTVDTNAPTINLNSPPDNNITSNTSITFNCTASDNVKLSNVTLYGNWSNWHANETNSSSINTYYLFTKTLSHGTYSWNCKACDNAGNCDFSASNNTLSIDTQGPIITFENPTPDDGDYVGNNWVYVNVSTDENANATLEWTNASGSYNFTMNGANNNFWYNITGLSETNYTFKVYANDSFDQWSSTSPVQITVSTTAPIIEIHSPTNQAYATTLINLNVTTNKQIDTWLYNLNGENKTFKNNFTLAPTPGSNTLYVYANDSTGNMGVDSITFTVNTTVWQDNFSWDSGINASNKITSEENATIKPCWSLLDAQGCWPYRKEINISGSSATLTNHQVKINLNLTQEHNQGKINSSCKDLRFSWLNTTSNNEEQLNYWIEECNLTGGNTSAWVKVPSLSASGETLYIYYGDLNRQDQSNATQVFNFFDDFNTVSNVTWGSKANNWQSTSSIATTTSSGSNSKLEAMYSFPNSYATELRWRGTSTGGYYRFGDGGGQYNLRFYVDPDDNRVNLYNGTSHFHTINSSEHHTYTIVSDFNNNEYKVFVDHNTTESISITSPAAGSYTSPVFYALTSNGLYLDWIAIRNYSSPEPAISTINTEETSLNNGSLETVFIDPNPFYAWDSFQANTNLPAGTNITFKILNSTNNSLCGDITNTQANNGHSVCSQANNYNTLKLRAELTTNSSSTTPVLIDWNISWTEQQQELISIIDSTSTEYTVNTTVLSNESGILDLNIIIQNNTEVHEINVHNYTQGSPNNEIKMDEPTNDDNLFEKTYSIDLSGMNCSNANFTVTAQGKYLVKCMDFDFDYQECNSKEDYQTLLTNLNNGQNYTFTLNATDPGFGETVEGDSDTMDSFIYGKSSKQTNNYGAHSLISVGSDSSSNDERGIIMFNLSNLPSSASIDNATLRLYFSEIPSGDSSSNRTHGVHRVQLSPQRDWEELEVTWNDYKNSNSWTSSGGDFNATPTDTAQLSSSNTGSWIEFDVAYDVQAFIDENNNYGWIIKDNDESGSKTRRYYYSSNYNTNTSRRPQLVVNYTLPDLTITNIDFNESSPIETKKVLVSANVTNLENAEAENVDIELNISQWNGSAWIFDSTQQQTINISGSSTEIVNFTWTAEPGNFSFSVTADPQNNTAEANYSNNNNSTYLNVGSWNVYYGHSNGGITIRDVSGNNFTFWLPSEIDGNLYALDKDSSIDFSLLKPLNGTDDFVEADSALGMSAFGDSVSGLFDVDGDDVADDTGTFVVWGRSVSDVPVVNSTNNSNFVTGVLWDSGDGGVEYNGSQDLVFVSELGDDVVGAYGVYDYELRVPALLREWKAGSDLINIYVEIR